MVAVGAVLSLTGRFARFGTQAEHGLLAWSGLDGTEVLVEDDGGDVARVAPALRSLAARCDLLLGPYSTALMRPAAAFAIASDRLLWNHGGSGDDVQAAAPGRMVSVLTPTSRYAGPFVRLLADRHPGRRLRLVEGRGSFGRQVIAGARAEAGRLGVPLGAGGALFVAGTFEEDTALVARVLGGGPRPEPIGTVAAGVQEFGDAVPDPDGVFGVAQWVPEAGRPVSVGPDPAAFLARYRSRTGAVPDYPAVQAAAAAALAVHCARLAGSTAAAELWPAAVALRCSTMFGGFAVDPATGAQLGHEMALVRWRDGRMVREGSGDRGGAR